MTRLEQPEPRSRDEASVDLSSGDPVRMAGALVAAALYENDRQYVESLIIKYLQHDDPWGRGASAIAAGHIARIHRCLSTAEILPLLERLLADSRTRERRRTRWKTF